MNFVTVAGPFLAAACFLLVRGPSPATPAQELGIAATKFLATLDAGQRAKAALDFASAERATWGFVPNEYPGLGVRDMSVVQRRAAHDLLRAVASQAGYLTVTSVMALDDLLRQLEERGGKAAPHRDAERYYLAVFGDPAAAQPWAFRLQGHHVSVNCSVDPPRGAVSATPLFLGTNPAEVRDGAKAGSRVLGDVEDLGFALLHSLDATQRERALLPGAVPADVVLGPARADDSLGEPAGLPAAQLNPEQLARLRELVARVVDRLRPELAAAELARVRVAELHFAWCGAQQPGAAHYFRLHGRDFVFEYDNVQNNANHVHTVWRSPGRDFGRDWLGEHYRKEHAPVDKK